jgi:hypothetical protein
LSWVSGCVLKLIPKPTPLSINIVNALVRQSPPDWNFSSVFPLKVLKNKIPGIFSRLKGPYIGWTILFSGHIKMGPVRVEPP